MFRPSDFSKFLLGSHVVTRFPTALFLELDVSNPDGFFQRFAHVVARQCRDRYGCQCLHLNPSLGVCRYVGLQINTVVVESGAYVYMRQWEWMTKWDEFCGFLSRHDAS